MEVQACRSGFVLGFFRGIAYIGGASRLICGKRVKQMQQRRKQYQSGSVALDPRSNVWSFRWRDADGKRRAERIGKYSTKREAMKAAEGFRLRINRPEDAPAVTVEQVAQRYILERLPSRHSTSRGYKRKLDIIQRDLAKKALPLKAYETEQWLKMLKSEDTGQPFAPKTKAHVKNVLHILHDCAMVWEYIPVGRNPMSLIRIEGAGRRQKDPIILSMDEFRKLLAHITQEPHRTMVILAACLGLRISEVSGLRWQDFDWTRSEVKIERSVVEGHTADVKTQSSRKRLPIDERVISAVQAWRLKTAFPDDSDYVFASPTKLGKKPLRGYQVQTDVLSPTAVRLGLGPVGWHSLRHSYRTWLDEVDAPVSVQKDLMRHSTIAMTMDGYGRGVPSKNRSANAKVVGKLLNRTVAGLEAPVSD
jgi:integrase